VTLLAQFFSQPENGEIGNPSFVCKAYMTFSAQRHHNCTGTGEELKQIFFILWQKY
jgi:hypothetical protein